MSPVTTDQLIQRNRDYAASMHKVLPNISECKEWNIDPPRIMIVTCADPRVFPEEIFKLSKGEAVVFRTIAGHPQPAENSIIGAQAFVPSINQMIIVHHTDCGSTHFTETGVLTSLKEQIPSDLLKKHGIHENGAEFGAKQTGHDEEELKKDFDWLKNHECIYEKFKEDGNIRAFLYDIKTGLVKEID